MKNAIAELYGVIAEERLQRDISSREPTAKYGVFADPLLDEDLRDAGVAQDAVIVNQELQLASKWRTCSGCSKQHRSSASALSRR